VYCCRPMNGDEFEGKAAESLKNETLPAAVRPGSAIEAGVPLVQQANSTGLIRSAD